MYIPTYISTHVCMYIYIYICIYILVCVCVCVSIKYIFIYLCTYEMYMYVDNSGMAIPFRLDLRVSWGFELLQQNLESAYAPASLSQVLSMNEFCLWYAAYTALSIVQRLAKDWGERRVSGGWAESCTTLQALSGCMYVIMATVFAPSHMIFAVFILFGFGNMVHAYTVRAPPRRVREGRRSGLWA